MQKFLIIVLAAFLLPFFVSAQPVVTSATRVKLFKGDSIFTAPLSGLASAIGAGGNRPDSAWATGTLSSPVYWGKGLTSNIIRRGKVSVNTQDTFALFNLLGRNPVGSVRTFVQNIVSPPRSAFSNPAFANGSFFDVQRIDINPMKPNHFGALNYGLWTDRITVDSTTNLAVNKPGNSLRNTGFNTDGEASWLPKWYWSTEQAYYPGAGNSGGLDWEYHLEVFDTLNRFNRPFNLLGSHNGNKYSAGFRVNEFYVGKPYEADYGLRIKLNTGEWSTDEPFTFRINNSTRVGPIFERFHAGAYQNILDWRGDGRLKVGGSAGIEAVNVLRFRQDNAFIPKIVSETNNLRFDSTELYINTTGNRHFRFALTSGTTDFMDFGFDGNDFFVNKNASNYPFFIHKNARDYALRVNASGKISLGSNTAFFDLDEFQTTNDLGGGLGLRNLAQEWFSLRCSAAKTLILQNDQHSIDFHLLNSTSDPNGSRTGAAGDLAWYNDGDNQSSLYMKYSGASTNTGWGKLLNLIDPNGATPGQVLKWNGSAWAPGTDNTAGGVPSGTSTQTLRYDATNTLVATSQITNDGSTVGIGTAPNASYELDVAGKTRAQGLRAEGTNMHPTLELANTTPTTGKTFTLGSSNTGNFYISSDVAGDAIAVAHATGDVTITPKLKLNTYGTTATAILGRNAGGEVSEVTLGNGLSLTSGTLSAAGGAVNVIRPTNITSDQDDYAPTGWGTANKVLITGDATGRAITSFSTTGITDGHTKTIINNGDNYIYFPAEHPDGTASNRIDYTRDFILTPKSAVDIMYDATDARWMITSPNYNTNRDKQLTYTVQPGSVTAADWGHVAFGVVNVGSLNQAQPIAGVPGTFRLNTSTATTGGAYMGFAKAQTLVTRYGDAHLDLSADVSIPTLSDGSNRFYAALHFGTDQTTATFPNVHQCGIRYKDDQNGGRWQGYTRAGTSAETVVDLGVTVAANTLYSIRIVVDEARTEARFYINNVYSGRIEAAGNNFPAAATSVTTRALCFKESGSTARSMDVAKMELTITY